MANEVSLQRVEARTLAAVHASATPETLPDAIYRGLDQVWPLLRDQGVKTDHNIVVYRDGLASIDVGVEVLGPFEPSGEVVAATTPAGEAATTTHWGEYGEMKPAYRALETWCASHHRTMNAAWEVYGDWDDDPAKRRTDIFFGLEPA